MTQKELAVKCLEILDIYKPYVRKFKSKAGIPCFFENFAGFWANQEPELWQKIKEVEEKNKVLVYAITHEYVGPDECWSMLCVPEDSTMDDLLQYHSGRQFYAYAFTWNKSCDIFSEFGDIFIKAFGGGIKRIY